MSNNIAIRVENLSKLYRIGLAEQRHETLMGAVASFLRSPISNFRNLRKLSRFDDLRGENRRSKIKDCKPPSPISHLPSSISDLPSPTSLSDVIWALRDISFEVKRGEVLGIIGRNGAGKSTLLKILSRVTEPTTGRAEIHGRVGSLLEVGTGFHPDLTGRENIYLNGTILGMKKREIDKRFDEIVEFSGVEKFIDTPVKRYSSGMRVRLAFSVAAHLEPEILLVDEVLAVGDAQFQKKCIGKMDTIARGGRTVLFVSHAMGTIAKLCGRAILLADGDIACQGAPQAVIARYLEDGAHQAEAWPHAMRAEGFPFVLHDLEIVNLGGKAATQLPNHEPFRVRLTYEITEPMVALRVGFRLHSQDSTPVLSTADCDHLPDQCAPRAPGVYVSEVEFPGQLLNVGRYYLWIGIDIPMVACVLSVDQAASFTIEATGGVAAVNDRRLGVVAPVLPWKTTRKPV